MNNSCGETIALIGLGLMARSIDTHEHRPGYLLTTYNRGKPVVTELCALDMTASRVAARRRPTGAIAVTQGPRQALNLAEQMSIDRGSKKNRGQSRGL